MEVKKWESNIEINEKDAVSMKSYKHEVGQMALNKWPETDTSS